MWASRASTAFPRSNLVWMRSPRSTRSGRRRPLPEERRTSRRRTTRSIGICCTCRERPPDLTVGTSSTSGRTGPSCSCGTRTLPNSTTATCKTTCTISSSTRAISSKRWMPSRRTRRARSGSAGARARSTTRTWRRHDHAMAPSWRRFGGVSEPPKPTTRRRVPATTDYPNIGPARRVYLGRHRAGLLHGHPQNQRPRRRPGHVVGLARDILRHYSEAAAVARAFVSANNYYNTKSSLERLRLDRQASAERATVLRRDGVRFEAPTPPARPGNAAARVGPGRPRCTPREARTTRAVALLWPPRTTYPPRRRRHPERGDGAASVNSLHVRSQPPPRAAAARGRGRTRLSRRRRLRASRRWPTPGPRLPSSRTPSPPRRAASARAATTADGQQHAPKGRCRSDRRAERRILRRALRCARVGRSRIFAVSRAHVYCMHVQCRMRAGATRIACLLPLSCFSVLPCSAALQLCRHLAHGSAENDPRQER